MRGKNIPPRYAIRLDDLRAWHVIFATAFCVEDGKRHAKAKQDKQIAIAAE